MTRWALRKFASIAERNGITKDGRTEKARGSKAHTPKKKGKKQRKINEEFHACTLSVQEAALYNLVSTNSCTNIVAGQLVLSVVQVL